ncbi:hypothetical protein [Flavobacterium sp. K5-23]|uniref:hypothetical protein n=1 Tax=Flavobacterium sp. K5-23 TaxID=2746225 RepID=UPI00200FA080|nr:hypothetical protein [Flavobacterium sp. K5-23]UQD56419.1 hypothetical protein FLAK523_08505 [Flavobacterium sp. K5-23]
MKMHQIRNTENLQKFTNILNSKINNGFVIIEKNEKLPFAVLSKKGVKVNHNINFLISCFTLGLWSIPWMYTSFVSSKEKKILVGIDEDGNTFEDKCYN